MKTETLIALGIIGVAAYVVYTVSYRTGQAIRAQERVPSRIVDAAETIGTGLLAYLNGASSSPSGQNPGSSSGERKAWFKGA